MNQCILGITHLFIIYLIIYSIYLFIATMIENINQSKYQKRQKLRNQLRDDYYIPVSIIITVHNEEEKIVKKIKELQTLSYKSFEIIIVDNGSTDDTCNKVIKAFELQRIERPIRKIIKTKDITEIYQTMESDIKITMIRKKQDRKQDAINAGINTANNPYFISIDTSYTLPENILENLFRPILENDNVIACSGITEIGKLKETKKGTYNLLFPKRILDKGQVLNYSKTSFFIKQQKGDLVGLKSLTLFKKAEVLQVLGHDSDSSGENFELLGKLKEAHALQKEEYRFKCAPNAICFIEPKNDVFQTRKIWQQGLQRNNIRERKAKVKTKHKILNTIFLLYDLYDPFIKGIGIIGTILAIFLNLIDSKTIFLFFASYLLVTGALSIYTFGENIESYEGKIKVNILTLLYSTLIERTLLNVTITAAKTVALLGGKNETIHDER